MDRTVTSPTDPIEAGDPADDHRAFRRCLGQFSTGVTVMTTVADGKPVGVTANSFSSLSLDPPLVLWSIARGSRSFDAYRRAGHFAVNILRSEQVALSQLFASPVEDRFAGIGWRPGRLGSPVLTDILVLFECETEAIHDGGDHAIMVGRVKRYERHAGHALLYAQGRYAVAEDHPSHAMQAGPGSAGARPRVPTDAVRLMSVLSYVATYATDAFDTYRQSEGVNLPQSRAIFALSEGSSTLEEIVRRSYLSRLSAEDALASLAERGVVAGAAETYELTETGRALLGKLIGQLDRFERELFAGLAKADLAATRRVMDALHARLRPGARSGSQ